MSGAPKTGNLETSPAPGETPLKPQRRRWKVVDGLAKAGRHSAMFLRRHTRDARTIAVHARAWRRFSIDGAVLLTIAAAVILGTAEMLTDRVVIRPIQVPDDLAARGYDEDVVAQRLIDAWRSIALASPTSKERTGLAGDWEQTDVALPYAELSLRGLVAQAQAAFGIVPRLIGGEIVRDEEGLLSLTLRMSGGDSTMEPVVVAASASVEDLLVQGGEAVMRLVDPYVLASWLAETRPQEARVLAQACLADTTCFNERAQNLFGRLAMLEGRPGEAADWYRQAWTTSQDQKRPFVDALFNEASAKLELAEQALMAADNGLVQAHLADARRVLAEARAEDPESPRFWKTGAYLNAQEGLAALVFDDDRATACSYRADAVADLGSAAGDADGYDATDITSSQVWLMLDALDCP